MDIRAKFTLIIPEALIEALEITEDTIFVVEYKDGELSIEPISDYDDEDCDDFFDEDDEMYGDSYEEGVSDGYAEGYRSGFNDAINGLEYKESKYSDCGVDCDYNCRNCRFKEKNKRTFN